MRVWLTIAGVVSLLDQVTKQLAEAMLAFGESVAVLPFFNITLAYNTGAAFSFLAQAGGWQRWFFAALALTVSGIILLWLRRLKPQEKWSGVALALILGGALGNVIDRLLFGHVIDFLDVYYTADQCMALFSFEPLAQGMRCHWPAFNIADSAISVGAVMMVIDSLRGGKKAAA